MPRLILLAVVAAAALVATACGGTSRYAIEPTRECLSQVEGIRVRAPAIGDLVARTALGGSLNVKFENNQVTLAFGQDDEEARRLATGYRRHRGKNIGIESALQEEKNVVMVWGITPADPDRSTVVGCLKT